MHAMCANRSRHAEAVVPAPAPREPHERVTDANRRRTAAVISRAFADGLLDVDEMDERLTKAYAARSHGDLTALTTDLPRDWIAAVEAEQRRTQAQLAQRHQRRGELRGYLAVMALLVTIWLVTAVFAGAWYPWPLWPALGWGIPLLLGRRDRLDDHRALPATGSPPYRR